MKTMAYAVKGFYRNIRSVLTKNKKFLLKTFQELWNSGKPLLSSFSQTLKVKKNIWRSSWELVEKSTVASSKDRGWSTMSQTD